MEILVPDLIKKASSKQLHLCGQEVPVQSAVVGCAGWDRISLMPFLSQGPSRISISL